MRLVRAGFQRRRDKLPGAERCLIFRAVDWFPDAVQKRQTRLSDLAAAERSAFSTRDHRIVDAPPLTQVGTVVQSNTQD